MHPKHLFSASTLFLFCTAMSVGSAHAQFGGYRYNNYGQLVDGRGQLANVHQEIHDMQNSTLYTTGAVAVSNTVDPNFTQATLTQIEAAMAPTPEPGGLAMSRLYLTPTNPYTPGAGVQSGTPTGYNHDHYNQIMLDAPVGGYVPTQSGAYIAKTHPDSSSELYNRGFHTYEASPKFLAAKEAAGGQGGGIVFLVNQSAESFSHLRAISGSNVFMTAYVRPYAGAAIALGGQVVLNPEHNTNAALDTNQYGPAFVAGVSQIQGQTLNTGNEAGFWVTGSGSNTGISNWGDGSANSIVAAFDPSAQFHVHTHPSGAGPSYIDMINSATLNGMPGMVVSSTGNYAYGFQLEGGRLPTPDGYIIFKQPRLDAQTGAGYGSLGGGGMDGVGHNDAGSTTHAITTSGGATYGMGGQVGVTQTTVTNARGEPVNHQTTFTGMVNAGVAAPGASVTSSTTPGINLHTPGFNPTAAAEASTPFGSISISTDYLSIDVGFQPGIGRPGATVGVGAQHSTKPTSGGSDSSTSQSAHTNDSGTGSGPNSGYNSGTPSSSTNPSNSGSFGSPGY